MRKSFWIVLALLVVGGAQVAHADSFTYAYTDTKFGFSWTTEAISAVTMPTTVPTADLTATSTSGLSAGCTISSVVLDSPGLGVVGVGRTDTFFNPPFPCGLGGIDSDDRFTLTDYSTPGTYAGAPGNTLVVTAVATTPEPSSVALMLLGVGILFVTRKRMGHSRPSTV
jgi:hypothetical protein